MVRKGLGAEIFDDGLFCCSVRAVLNVKVQ
jgi:hypothetical protein